MSWATRIQDKIVLLSPSKVPISAYWLPPDDVTFSRHIAIHDIPNRSGSYVQDMGTEARRYQITLAFEGENADLVAKTAEDLLFAEQGAWTVIHPSDLFLKLNLVSCSRTIDPVNSGGFVILKTEWVEIGIAKAGLSGITESVATIIRTSITLSSMVIEGVKNAINLYQRGLLSKYIYDCVANLNTIISAWALNDDANSLVASIKNMAQRVDQSNVETFNTSLYQACLLAQKSDTSDSLLNKIRKIEFVSDKICKDMQDNVNLYTNLGGSFARKMVNYAISSEIFLISSIIAFSDTVVASNIKNRDECISLLEILETIYNEIVDTVTLYETKAKDLDFTVQYIAFRDSMETLEKLRSLLIRYLLQELFDLRALRRIIVGKPTTLLQIAYQYMGANAATIDDVIEKLIKENELHGEEILLLPVGKEIIIY
ncbi:MAG: hypothetical protein Pg6A_15760 [Termitinemataceae bacterium]|nr:MAG: hypothetical protein Pg6A_15760 [Termitinemataceae bacterium]